MFVLKRRNDPDSLQEEDDHQGKAKATETSKVRTEKLVVLSPILDLV